MKKLLLAFGVLALVSVSCGKDCCTSSSGCSKTEKGSCKKDSCSHATTKKECCKTKK